MRFLLIIAFPFIAYLGMSQTRIAPPPARVEFSELGKLNKKKLKELKLKDQYKGKKLKDIEKTLKKHSNLDQDEIEEYKVLISGLDSMELETFEEQLQEQVAKQDPDAANKVRKAKDKKRKLKKARNEIQAFKRDSITGTIKRDSTSWRRLKRLGNEKLKDSLSYYKASYKGKGLALDTLGADSSLLNIDSLGLAYADSLSLKKVVNDSTLQANASNEVETFMENFAKERIGAQELGLPDGSADPTARVEEFVPELEKFDYKKPEIPKKKLTKALVEKEKKRKKDELKKIITDQSDESLNKKKEWINRWVIGGYMEYNPLFQSIELAPTLAYGVSKKIMVGAGYGTIIPLTKERVIDDLDIYRIFLTYDLIRSFYLHLESEWRHQKPPEEALIRERSTYIGLGRTFRYRSVSTNILGLYNLSAPNQIDSQRFSVRFAINFHP